MEGQEIRDVNWLIQQAPGDAEDSLRKVQIKGQAAIENAPKPDLSLWSIAVANGAADRVLFAVRREEAGGKRQLVVEV